MNKVFLVGNVGMDGELKVTPGGQAVLNFSVATSETYVDKAGVKQEKTDWHRCEMWGARAEKLAQYIKKGTKLVVEGSIHTRSYEKDGEKRYTTNIKVFNVEFAGGSKKSDADESDIPAETDDDFLT